MNWSNLQEDYERLGSFKAIAKLYQVAPETVSRKAKELGVSSRRRWRGNLDPDEIRKLYDDGATVDELADKFHSSPSTIYLRLWMAGAEMRTPGPTASSGDRNSTRSGARQPSAAPSREPSGSDSRASAANAQDELAAGQLFHQALLRARLSFETQLRELRRYYPDIKLHQKPVIIEIDSWGHQLPKSAEFDRQRDAALRKAGFEIVRFMNEEVEADADACVQQVIERFGLEPEENPVALIRTRRGGEPVPIIPVYSDGDIV